MTLTVDGYGQKCICIAKKVNFSRKLQNCNICNFAIYVKYLYFSRNHGNSKYCSFLRYRYFFLTHPIYVCILNLMLPTEDPWLSNAFCTGNELDDVWHDCTKLFHWSTFPSFPMQNVVYPFVVYLRNIYRV